MKLGDFTKYIGVFILAVLIIAVYKTFDSMGIIFGYIKKVLLLFVPIFEAFVIAFILYPLCAKIEKFLGNSKPKFLRSHRRGVAVIVVYIAFLLLIIAFISLMFPAIVKSVSDFVNQLPYIIKNIQSFANSLKFADFSLPSPIEHLNANDIFKRFNLSDFRVYLDSVLGISKVIFNFVLSLIISVYILLDRTGLISTARKIGELIFPKKSRSVILKYINRTFNIMYKYIYCQLLDAMIVCLLALVLLLVMRVRYAPVLAIFIGLFNIIPYFGAIIACSATALLTVFTASLSKGIWVAVLLIVLQQTDANVIQPRLVHNALEIRPFWVLCGVSVGGGLFGISGIILAVPVMALIKTVFEDYIDYMNGKKILSASSEENEAEAQ